MNLYPVGFEELPEGREGAVSGRDSSRDGDRPSEFLEWVQKQSEPVRASHVKEALYDEHGLEEQTEGTWWEMTAHRALNHAAEQGYIDDSGRSYEWVGNRER